MRASGSQTRKILRIFEVKVSRRFAGARKEIPRQGRLPDLPGTNDA